MNDKEIQESLNKAYPITSVARLDLINLEYNQDDVLSLTDEDMQHIANIMADVYIENGGFWDSLESIANNYKLKKEEL